jgi:hypothetical protein
MLDNMAYGGRVKRGGRVFVDEGDGFGHMEPRRFVVTEVSFANTKITNEDLAILKPYLERFSYLKLLNIDNTLITGKAFAHLYGLKHLSELYCMNCSASVESSVQHDAYG